MKHKASQGTSTGIVTVSVETTYYVPRKGDTIYSSGHACKLTEDLKPRIDFTYNGEKYVGEAMRTKDGSNRIVFIGKAQCSACPDGEGDFTWRVGESYDLYVPAWNENCALYQFTESL